MFEDIKKYLLEEKKLPKFRFKQFETAVFSQLITHFNEITVYPKWLREELSEKFEITTMHLVESAKSNDTTKFVLKTHDGNFVEAVLMWHTDGRRTVCVSSQVFCPLGCTFCATGANQYKRNLTTQEIIEQVLFVNRHLKHEEERVTNVVFMGMGEPFMPYKQVMEAVKTLNDPAYFNIGARHITVSTSGIVPRIREYADFDIKSRLAISLHAPNDKLRSEIMPINTRYSLSELMDACDYWTSKRNKRISYEYVLIKGINDTPKHAHELVNLLKKRLHHVNLLIYNPHEFSKFERPGVERVMAFKQILDENGIHSSIRISMGDDISGACGQLSGKLVKKGKKVALNTKESIAEAVKSV